MRVLVVEDNDDLVALVTKALARAGLDVDAAQNVADAEASLRTVQYAAVVLDLGLPDADGLTLLDQMRRRRDQTPVLILSARGGLDDRVGGLNKGASDYMVKPFSTDELIARLQALLRRSPGSGRPDADLGQRRAQDRRPPGHRRRPDAEPAGARGRRARSAAQAQRQGGVARFAAGPGLRLVAGRRLQRDRGLRPSPAQDPGRSGRQRADPHDPRRRLPDGRRQD